MRQTEIYDRFDNRNIWTTTETIIANPPVHNSPVLFVVTLVHVEPRDL